MIKVVCYIDGFNLYHALDDLSRATRGKKNYLKWVDLRKLMGIFTDRTVHQIVAIKYFSAYATWIPGSYGRHQIYVQALQQIGVEVILGQFKEKDIYCKVCNATFKGHEEKESDVNLSCHLMDDAHQNLFDQAFIVSRDSDLSQPIRFLKHRFPKRRVKVIAPPLRRHSKELWALADSTEIIVDGAGKTICTRPSEYAPP